MDNYGNYFYRVYEKKLLEESNVNFMKNFYSHLKNDGTGKVIDVSKLIEEGNYKVNDGLNEDYYDMKNIEYRKQDSEKKMSDEEKEEEERKKVEEYNSLIGRIKSYFNSSKNYTSQKYDMVKDSYNQINSVVKEYIDKNILSKIRYIAGKVMNITDIDKIIEISRREGLSTKEKFIESFDSLTNIIETLDGTRGIGKNRIFIFHLIVSILGIIIIHTTKDLYDFIVKKNKEREKMKRDKKKILLKIKEYN